jgi:ketosteroid isomerase-like protein
VRGLALTLLCLTATPLGAQVNADDPVAVVEELFAAMKAGNADAMEALLHEDVRLVTTGVRDGTPVARVVDVAGWLEAVRGSERELDERLYDTEVHVDQGLASVWTRYDLFVDGVFSHCGVDAFLLVATGGGWRILSIADTRTQEGCRGS